MSESANEDQQEQANEPNEVVLIPGKLDIVVIPAKGDPVTKTALRGWEVPRCQITRECVQSLGHATISESGELITSMLLKWRPTAGAVLQRHIEFDIVPSAPHEIVLSSKICWDLPEILMPANNFLMAYRLSIGELP